MITFCAFRLLYLTCFSPGSKIQKYSPTESAKVYDKAVNRKNTVHFYPRQTLDFIANNMAHASLTNDVKRHIVRQYLDVSCASASTFALLLVSGLHIFNHDLDIYCFFKKKVGLCKLLR